VQPFFALDKHDEIIAEKRTMGKHYLYGLTPPGATKFSYIGVTMYPKRRLKSHRRRWPGVKMSVLVVGSRAFIYALEIEAIRALAPGGENVSPGGHGGAARYGMRKMLKKKPTRWYVEPPRKVLDRPERNVSLVRLRQRLRNDAKRRGVPLPC
jgi:hypothetical protein